MTKKLFHIVERAFFMPFTFLCKIIIQNKSLKWYNTQTFPSIRVIFTIHLNLSLSHETHH